jgi:hypothetical protein
MHALTEKDAGVNVPLFRPFALGTGFLAVAMDMPNQTDMRMLASIMEDYELPMALLDEHAAGVPEIGDATSIDDVMSPALSFLHDLLLPLEIEPDTCFVAMPFTEPFEEQYAVVYQPMMAAAGYRTMRAWGGLASEFHVDLLMMLIDKCGAVLAELTGLNPNVVLELGYGWGRDKVLIPMADVAHPISLANLQGIAVLPYDSSRDEWHEDMLHGMGRLILDAMMQVVRGESPSSS